MDHSFGLRSEVKLILYEAPKKHYRRIFDPKRPIRFRLATVADVDDGQSAVDPRQKKGGLLKARKLVLDTFAKESPELTQPNMTFALLQIEGDLDADVIDGTGGSE